MDFNTLSGKRTFIEERNYRLSLLEKLGLFPYLSQKVTIKGKPITSRTAKKAFSAERFEDLSKISLAVWLESEELIKKYQEERETYAKQNT